MDEIWLTGGRDLFYPFQKLFIAYFAGSLRHRRLMQLHLSHVMFLSYCRYGPLLSYETPDFTITVYFSVGFLHSLLIFPFTWGAGVKPMDQRLRQLREIIRQRSLRIGDFTLTSGKKSSYYLDCRMTTLDPNGALLIGRLILQRIRDHNIQADATGGLTMGADPIATAV